MGLSSKQVSNDRLDWNKHFSQAHQNLELPKRPTMKRQHQQQNHETSAESFKCPRCDSTNTKFCYFNNYNQSQPRHYCRACMRHWTKGGTLRDVPVGGGRKNKRIKRTTASPSATSSATTDADNNRRTIITTKASNSMDPHQASHASQKRQNDLSLELVCRKNLAGVLCQPRNYETPLTPQDDHLIDTCNLDTKFFVSTEDLRMGLPQPLSQCLQFPFSSSSYFDANLSSVTTSFQASDVYDHGEELIRTIEEPTINGIMSSTTSICPQPWQAPMLDSGMEISNAWNWEDIDSLVSTDLNEPWEDSDVKS